MVQHVSLLNAVLEILNFEVTGKSHSSTVYPSKNWMISYSGPSTHDNTEKFLVEVIYDVKDPEKQVFEIRLVDYLLGKEFIWVASDFVGVMKPIKQRAPDVTMVWVDDPAEMLEYVSCYMNGTEIQDTDVNMRFTFKEFSALKNLAGNDSVEDFILNHIKQLIEAGGRTHQSAPEVFENQANSYMTANQPEVIQERPSLSLMGIGIDEPAIGFAPGAEPAQEAGKADGRPGAGSTSLLGNY